MMIIICAGGTECGGECGEHGFVHYCRGPFVVVVIVVYPLASLCRFEPNPDDVGPVVIAFQLHE